MQIRLFLKVLSISLIGIALMAVIFYLYSNREINENYRQFHIHAQNFLDYLLPAVALSVLAAVLSAASITIFFPHKIAGPLHRIETDMKEKISKGDLTVRFNLRKGDDVSDLAEAINYSLDKLKQKIEKAKKPAEELDTVIKNMEESADKNVGKLIKEINEALKEFRL
jgi:methyl-accepting chemotaxis protein